jgi:hypothetical protein
MEPNSYQEPPGAWPAGSQPPTTSELAPYNGGTVAPTDNSPGQSTKEHTLT